MKPLFIALSIALCLCGIGCKKETVYILNPDPSANIGIRVSDVTNDSTISLAWDGYSAANFKEYRLVRYYQKVENGKLTFVTEPIATLKDSTQRTFREKVPYTDRADYQLQVFGDTGMIVTRQVSYERKQAIFRDQPDDALIDTAKNLVYVINRNGGTIRIYDYEVNKLVKQLKLFTTIGFCDLGVYNGKKELYVPRGDGWLEIYSADSLALIDRWYLSGKEVISAVFNNNLLFVSSTKEVEASPTNIFVFDRPSKSLLLNTGTVQFCRLLLLPGTTYEVVEATATGYDPARMYRFKFDASTNKAVFKTNNTATNIRKHHEILKAFPAGNLLITAKEGTVLDSTLTFIRYLSGQTNPTKYYADFAFNPSGSTVYAALLDKTTVEAIDYPGLQIKLSFTTTLPAKKILRDEDRLIVLSCGNATAGIGDLTLPYLSIEKIKL